MAAESVDLSQTVALLTASVVAVPLFRKLGLGSVLGYLTVGLIVGPFGFGLVTDPVAILHVAELGVVMFLFIIGLEMRPAKLWALRRDIFGLGLVQVLTCGALLSAVGVYLGGLSVPVAVVGAMGFVLSSTAVIMKMLDERGETATPAGQRAVSILLLEDLFIVPLLALVALLAAFGGGHVEASGQAIWVNVGIALAAIAAVVAAGRWLLNPLFGLVATLGGREIMLAASLMVVLGAALFMQWGGLSMAMGAFLAGVLLSESTFRNQLEADIDPFKGLLLGLFFLSVGMSLDLALVAREWVVIVVGVLAFMATKAAGIFVIALLFGASRREALLRAALFAQGGEFAFVLYAAALSAGVFDARSAAVMSAIVILSMALTPLVVLLFDRYLPSEKVSLDGVDVPDGLKNRVLIIGFGRFGQLVSQPLLARDVDVSLIEIDVDMIRAAGNFGFKVYYGDGTRLDVLRASGAETAEAILVCVNNPEAADKIVQLVKSEFPVAKLYVRSFDRGHTLRLIEARVDYQIRETFESALAFGRAVLVGLGFSPAEADDTARDVRKRDEERLALQLVGGFTAGRQLLRGNMTTPEPTPFTPPRTKAKPLSPSTAEVMDEQTKRKEETR
ncbi:monovalent cation:proton antiporter-2 (CPA2) family protein [Hyphomicrobium sp.]|uniref:monovalent cation:proton antiporter-2 (CPA2) family protein n=1 Tax=Hyphomicrobium sp. TaxID=82 RepID=UPI002E2F6A98|nr:monovalent cation:proton antiporter-2 (CPA2) family protein [Hyphomicrobium sp.]HEX2841640.1 monovalent cation:proton antiporter-2 (CPA2) family protein [Hyphomicrobium sp.]